MLVLGFGTALAQGTYGIDVAHSNVGFKIRHLVSKVSGEFADFDGTIVADFADLDKSSVEFTIQAASIDTKNEKRDGHLRSPDFFDAEKYPEITFISSKITKVDGDTFAVAGTLTMRGVAKEITFMVDFLGAMDVMGGTRAGYELTTTLNRKDYGVSWNRALDAGGFLLGDEVEVVWPSARELRGKRQAVSAVRELEASGIEAAILYIPIFVAPAVVAHAANLLSVPGVLACNESEDSLSQLAFLAAGGAIDQLITIPLTGAYVF